MLSSISAICFSHSISVSWLHLRVNFLLSIRLISLLSRLFHLYCSCKDNQWLPRRQIHSSLLCPLTTWFFGGNQNYWPFLASLKYCVLLAFRTKHSPGFPLSTLAAASHSSFLELYKCWNIGTRSGMSFAFYLATLPWLFPFFFFLWGIMDITL